MAWNLGYPTPRHMKQEMTAREYVTAKIIASKELIGQDRRDMVSAKQAAAVAIAGSSITTDQDADKYFRQVIKSIYPLEIPEREQTPEDIANCLTAYVAKTNGPKHSNTSG